MNQETMTAAERKKALSAFEATKLSAAQSAFESWRKTSFEERAQVLRKVASLMRAQADELAALHAAHSNAALGRYQL